LHGGGRHLTFEELDKELANWVRENRAKKLKVTRRMILKKAEKLFIRESEEEVEFKVSFLFYVLILFFPG
jgi:hypothetical protein